MAAMSAAVNNNQRGILVSQQNFLETAAAQWTWQSFAAGLRSACQPRSQDLQVWECEM